MIKGKNYFLIIIIAVSYIGCNGKDKNTEASIANDQVKEKELIDRIVKNDSNQENTKALIVFYVETNQIDKADKQRIKLLEKDSLNYAILQDLAVSAILKEDTINALKYYEKLITLNFPARDIALQELAQIYAGKNDEKCLQIADGFLEMPSPFSKSIGNFLKGYFFSLRNDKLKAISYLNASLKDDPRLTNASQELGLIYFDKGEYQKSIDVLAKATALNNGFCDGYFTMGKSFEKLGDKERAINSYGFALQCNPNDVEAREKLKLLGAE